MKAQDGKRECSLVHAYSLPPAQGRPDLLSLPGTAAAGTE